MQDDLRHVQTILDKSSPKQRFNIMMLLKSNGVTLRQGDGGATIVDASQLHPDLLCFIKKQNSVWNPTPLNVEEEQPSKVDFPSVVVVPPVEPVKKGKKVTIVTEDAEEVAISEKKSQWADVEELERQLKQNVSLRSSQLRIRKKIKDLLKKISKHRHVTPDKNYGQDLKDDDGGGLPADDSISIVDENIESVGDNDEEPYAFNEYEYGDESREHSEDGDNDDDDNVTEDMVDHDDDSKTADETEELDTDDGDTSVRDSDDATEADTSVDEEALDVIVDASLAETENMTADDQSNASENKLDFKTLSMTERFNLYKGILQTEKNIDFGDISELGLDGAKKS